MKRFLAFIRDLRRKDKLLLERFIKWLGRKKEADRLEQVKKMERKKVVEAKSFKKLAAFFEKIRVKRPIIDSPRRRKKGGRGYTKSPYNWARVKRRRKIAQASRRRNRGQRCR